MAVPSRRHKAKTLVKRDFYAQRNRESNEIHKKRGNEISESEHKERIGLLKQLGLIKDVKQDG